MNFLSNLWGAIKTGASSVANSLNTALQSVKGSTIASASSALNYNNPANNALQAGRTANMTPLPNMTVMPTATDPGGAGRNGVSSNNLWYQAGQEQAVASATSQVRPSTYTSAPAQTSSRSSTDAERTDSYGRYSTADQGNPFDVNGKTVIPNIAWGGSSGLGGAGMTSVAGQGAPGQTGLGAFGQNFAGGMGTTSPLYNQPTSDEETRKKAGDTKSLNSPVNSALNAMSAQGAPTPIETPQVPEVIDAGFLNKIQQTISSTATSGLSEVDKQAIYSQLQTNLLAAKTRLDQQVALPENPVIDTQDQLDFINSSGDPFGVRQAIDAFRAEQTNLGDLQASRVEVVKSVQALNEAYRPIIKEIKDNPNMPKALARRKIEALAVTQKETLQGFLDQMEILNQQIDDQNEMVNRAFDIVTFSENRANRAQDNIRQNLQLMISSGAIAGFTDADINSYANAIGVSASALKKAKDDALKPKTNQQMIGTSETGYYSVVIDEETGKPLSKTLIMGATPKAPSNGNTLSVNDVEKLNTLYEDSGLVFNYGETEAGASAKINSAQTLSTAMAELEDDIRNGATNLQTLKGAYPELSGTVILQKLNEIAPQTAAQSKGPKNHSTLLGLLFGK